MSEIKPMSAAEYRAKVDTTDAKRPTEIVRLQSGSVFELRRPDLQAYMITGRLPQSLVTVGVKAWKHGAEKVTNDLSDKEAEELFVFMRDIVIDCTVTPKFVEVAKNKNEISASKMLKDDFNEVFAWAMGYQGVAGLSGLRSFRGGSKRRTARARADGKKQRRKSQQPLETVGPIQ